MNDLNILLDSVDVSNYYSQLSEEENLVFSIESHDPNA